LKQVVLNLGRNSLKFVESGYVRLCAQVVDGMVELSIEDSGPGIPPEKQGLLFNKFQESLDSLSQGTVRTAYLK
jgi:signal transduction histidine kinase